MKRLLAIACLAMLPAVAAVDPPGRVARLAFIDGQASVFADPDAGWEPAAPNSHLTSENSVWTEPRSRAELQAGTATLRLDGATQLDIARLDDTTLLGHVMRGSVALRVRHADRDESVTLTTPSARFLFPGNGRFRVDVDADTGESLLTVFNGSARMETSGGTVIVDTGRALRVAGGPRPSYAFEAAQETGLDDWALARESREGTGATSRYVSPRTTGWEDLDGYGEWRSEPDYGPVWFPTRVAVGWAPYRYGRWTWVRPWGWTWVDDAPWGYAPFHYGRWVWVGNRWGWYPGRYTPRPVWAPALVGWVGTPGWSVSVSSGPMNVVGWYPLSPYDRYEPWYAVRPSYVSSINNVVIVNRPQHRTAHNRDYGATVVGRDHFISHRPVQHGLTRLPSDVIARQPFTQGSVVLPPREEWHGRPRPQEPNQHPGGNRPPRPSFEPARPPADIAKPTSPPAPSAQPGTRPPPPSPATVPGTRPPENPVSPQRPAERPMPPLRPPPAPAERPIERPQPGPTTPPPSAQPATRPMPPVVPPPAPPARPVERPMPVPPPTQSAPPARPAERPAPPPSQPAPSARPPERPAPPAAPAASAAPAVRPAEKPPAAERTHPAEKPASRGAEKGGKPD